MNFRNVLLIGLAIVGYSLVGGSTTSCGGGEGAGAGGGSGGGAAGGAGGGRAGGTGGSGGATGGGSATGGGVATGGGSAGGGSAGGGSAGGGSAGGGSAGGGSAGGAAGGSAGGAAGGSAGGAAGGSAGGSAGGGAGGAGGGASNECTAPVNGCSNFDDRTSASASRTVTLMSFTIDPPCIRIKSGQTVNFVSQSTSHPGEQTCGPPNADMIINVPGGGTQNVTFTTTGLYGFRCTFHPFQMRGAIDVVQ